MMKWLVATVVLLWAVPTAAQSRYKKLCDPVDRRLCTQAVQPGETVPYPGQLYSVELAIQQSQKANWCDREIDYAVRKAEELADSRLRLAERLGAIDTIAASEKIELLEKNLQEARDAYAAASQPRWQDAPLLWGIVGGTVVAVALFGGAQLSDLAK